MAALAAIGPLLGKVAMVGGTLLSSAGAIQAGKQEQAAANYQAAQLEASGKAEMASSQRKALEERRRSDMAISRAKAVGAASGGGQDLNLIGAIEEEGTYNTLVAEWEGKERMSGRNAQAAASRVEGKNARKASVLKAGSTLLDGAYSFMDKYG